LTGAGVRSDFDHWAKLATKAAHIKKAKPKQLSRNPEPFARQLFDHHMEVFTLHCLE
jgi:hypothetical protein